jgi:nucleoside-diphosphate-sugar epimerase
MIYAVSSGRGDAATYGAVYRDGLKNIISIFQRRSVASPKISIFENIHRLLSKLAAGRAGEGASARRKDDSRRVSKKALDAASTGATLSCASAVECSKKALFVGSTSVYAQTDGDWVTESSPTEPDRATSLMLLEAEAVALAAGGSVARFSGIYGPGRSILLKKFLTKEARLEEGGDRWINQIHRDDGARALYHLATSSLPAGIYNVTDNTPVSQREVYQWIADYFQQPLPPSGPADLHRKRGWTSKRISNQKLRITGWEPQFSSYREALPTLPLPILQRV